MASNMSEHDRLVLEKMAASAEHYALDSEEMTTFDGECDPKRMFATMAQIILDRHRDKEK